MGVFPGEETPSPHVISLFIEQCWVAGQSAKCEAKRIAVPSRAWQISLEDRGPHTATHTATYTPTHTHLNPKNKSRKHFIRKCWNSRLFSSRFMSATQAIILIKINHIPYNINHIPFKIYTYFIYSHTIPYVLYKCLTFCASLLSRAAYFYVCRLLSWIKIHKIYKNILKKIPKKISSQRWGRKMSGRWATPKCNPQQQTTHEILANKPNS